MQGPNNNDTNNNDNNDNSGHSGGREDNDKGHGGDAKTVIFIAHGDEQHRFELRNPVQTGAALKQLAHIPPSDVLFLRRPGEDLIVRNEDEVRLKDGDHLYTQPPADYGGADGDRQPAFDVDGVELHKQPDGWTFAIFPAFAMPDAYTPRTAKLLIKLPPLFPQAAPDMFWVTPVVRVLNGGAPRGTSETTILGTQWQQFSWHLAAGAWKPGISTLRDFVACVRARLERRD